MAASHTSKSHKQMQGRKATIPESSRPPSPILTGITFSQHWTFRHLGSTLYPATISDSLGRDASTGSTPEGANTTESITYSSCQDGWLPCPSWPLTNIRTETNSPTLSAPQATQTPCDEGNGNDKCHGASQLTHQEYGAQPLISPLQQWWAQEVVDEPYHSIGAVLGNLAAAPNNCPVSSSVLESEGPVWGSICQGDLMGETFHTLR
jgi:hypothetical protein